MKMYRFKLHQGMHPNPYIQNELFILKDRTLEYQKMPLNEEVSIERFTLSDQEAQNLRNAFDTLFTEKATNEDLMEFMDSNFMSLKIIKSGEIIKDDTFNFESRHQSTLHEIHRILKGLDMEEAPLIMHLLKEVSE